MLFRERKALATEVRKYPQLLVPDPSREKTIKATRAERLRGLFLFESSFLAEPDVKCTYPSAI